MEPVYGYRLRDDSGNILDNAYFDTRVNAVLYAEDKKLLGEGETLVIQHEVVAETAN